MTGQETGDCLIEVTTCADSNVTDSYSDKSKMNSNMSSLKIKIYIPYIYLQDLDRVILRGRRDSWIITTCAINAYYH